MSTIEIDGVTYPFDSALPDKPAWEVEVNGDPVKGVETLSAINRAMGIGFLYGKSPAGPYNQGRMVNRGGAVIVPTVSDGDIMHFLALSQVRPLIQPDPILEFPRGQANVGEKPTETAARELLEETGLDLDTGAMVYLGRGNPDSALVHGANVHAFWLRLPAEYVNVKNGEPVLRPDIGGNPESKLMENIRKAGLIREDEFSSPSMMTSWAFGLVLQRIRAEERANTHGQIRPPYSVE